MADRIAELYQIASKKGVLAEGLTEEMFREQTKTDEGLRSFYDYASQNGMNLTEWPTFRGKARGEIMDDLPQQPQQPAQPAQPSSSAQPTQPAQQQSPDRITNAFAQMPDPLYSGQYQYHQQVADKEAQMQREQAAQLPLSQQDIDRQAEIDRLRQEQFQANFERAQRGEGYSLFPTDNQAAIDALERQKPDYLRGKAKTPKEVYDQTMGAWTANTPEGQKAKAQADRDTEAVLGNIKQQFDADVDSYAAGLQKQFDAEPQVKTVAERMNQKFVSTEFKQLQDRGNGGELSVADAQAQADAVWKEKYAPQIQSSAEALWKEKYVPQIQSYADKLWNDTYQEMYSNEASIIQNSLFRQMTDANGDYISQQLRRLGQEEVDRSTQSLSTTIAKDIAQLEKERSEAISRASARGQSRFGAYGAIGGQMSANTAYPREKADRLALLQQAQQFLDDARKMSTGAKQSGQGFWRDLGKGFGANIGDVDTWDMGMSQLVRSANLKKIVEKYEKNKDSLTDEEKALMDAAVTYMASSAYNSDKLSRGYKAGQTTAESIPFMLQFLIMPVNAMKDKVAKGILGYGIDQFGGKAAQAAGRKYGLGTALKETGTLLAGNMAAAGMQTGAFGGAKIAEGTISRMTGQIKPDFDEQGHLVYGGRENAQNLGNAVWNATVDTYVENLSEMILTSGDPIKALIRGSEWFGKTIGKSQIARFIADVRKTPFAQVAERMQFRNYPEEVAEEYVGGLLKWGASTDIHSAKEAGLDVDSQIDIWLGLAPTSIAFAGLGVVGYAVQGGINRWQNSQAAANLRKIMEEGEERKYLERLLTSQNSEAFAEASHDVVKSILRNDKIDDETKRDILDGIYTAYQSQVAQEAEQVQQAEEQQEAQQPQDRQTQLRQQAAQQAQQEVRGMAHQDGNVYYVGIKGKDGAEGYAVSGNLDMQQDDKGMYGTRGRDLVTVKMNDGSVQQVPADELVVRDIPVSADELMQERTDHYFAQYANEDLFHVGDKVYLKQNGQQSEESSTIVGINDEGIEVEIIDPNGQPNTTVIPHEQAAEALAVAEGETEDNIVTYVLPDNTQIRLRKTGDGVYEELSPDGQVVLIHNDEDLAELGAKPLVQEEAPANTGDQGMQTPVVAKPPYPTDETGNPAWGQMEVPQSAQVLYDLYKGNRESAKAYADDQLKEAQKVQKAAAKQASHNLNLAQRLAEEEQNAQFKAQADAAVKYWEDVKLAIAQIKTAEELAAEQAQRDKLMAAREQNRKTEEGTTANATMAERYNAAPKIIGNAGTTTLPDGRELAGHYVLIAPEGVTASHNAADNFRRSEGYPVTADGQSINDRDYTADKEEQQKVTSIAQNFNGNAIKNMPVISDEGLVYNGNGRMMAGQLAAINGTDASYMESLTKNAAMYGFTPEQVASIPHARVAFQLDERLPYSTQSLAIFNEQETQTQSNTGKAAGYARKLTPQAISEVLAAVDGFNTIDAFFNDRKAPLELINRLITEGIIAQRERAEMVNNDKLSDTGRERLSNILFGTAFSNETIRLMGDDAALKNSIMRALPQILDNKSLGEFSLESDINDAIRLLYEVRRAGVPFQSFVSQTVIAEDGQVHTAAEGYSPFQLLLAEEMSEGGVDAFRDVLTAYNNEARNVQGGQVDIFGDLLTPTELKNLILQRYGKEPNEQERPSASREADNPAEGTPASNEPAAEVTEPAKFVPERPNSKQLQGMSYNVAEAEDMLGRMVRNILDENGYEDVEIVGTKVIGSRVNGNAREDSDLDCLIEFKGNAREDSLFNLFEEQGIELDGVKVDINPITEGKSGTIEQFMRRSDEYLAEKAAKEAAEQKPLNDKLEYRLKVIEDEQGKEYADQIRNFVNARRADGAESVTFAVDRYFNVIGVYPSRIEAFKNKNAYDVETFKIEKETPNVYEQLAQAEAETDTNPTEAQKKAENYKQGHVTLWGLPITIENPKGSIRRGTDANGKQWEQEMHHTYGKIRRTEGVDGDHIDVFIGPNLTSDKVFVVDQRNVDTGEFDEHKCMLGFDSLEDAQNGYLSNYEEGWQGMGTVTEVTMDEFKKWIDSSHRKTKPFAEYKSVKTEGAADTAMEEQPDITNESAQEFIGKDISDVRATLGHWWMLDSQNVSGATNYYFFNRAGYGRLQVITDNNNSVKSALFVKVDGPAWFAAHPELKELEQAQKRKAERKPKKTEAHQSSDASASTATSERINNETEAQQPAQEPVYKPTVNDVIRTIIEKGKAAASKIFQRSFFDVVTTPDFIKELGISGERFTISYGVISRHFGKDAAHELTEDEWQRLPEALKTPFAITKYFEDKEHTKQRGYRIYTVIPKGDGFVVVGVDVKKVNQGKGKPILEINSISTVFGKDGAITELEEEIYRSEKRTPEQQSLLERPNSSQYPADRESESNSERKGTTNISNSQENEEKNEENLQNSLKSEEKVVNLQPKTNFENNTVFTADAVEEARKRLAARRNRLNMGLNPEDAYDYTIIAGAYVERGVRKFADFCKAMIQDLGDAVRPYLQSIYDSLRHDPQVKAQGWQKDFDSHDVVDNFDVDNFDYKERNMPEVRDYKDVHGQDIHIDDVSMSISGKLFYDLTVTEPSGHKRQTNLSIAVFNHELETKGIYPANEQPAEEENVRTPEEIAISKMLGTITKSKHTKTGEDLYVVSIPQRVSDDEFKVLKARAKANNGYYSSFAKNRGFVFKDYEDAKRFNTINDEEVTDAQTSANTEAVISQAETVAATAEAVETPEQVAPEVTPEAKEEQVTEVQQVIEQVDDAVEQINKQLAILGYYEADEADDAFHEFYGYIKSAEAKALKDIDRLAKQLAADLGIEVNKRKKLATANIPPAGGEVTFRLPLIDGFELYMCVSLSPNTGDYFKANGKRDDLAASSMFWRVEDPTKGGMARYKTGNVNEGTLGSKIVNVTYEELLNEIKRIAKDYLPKVEEASAPVEHLSDLLEEAKKRKAASDKRKKDKTRIPDGQQVLSLFDDAVEDLTEAARQEEQLNDNNNGNINESTEGASRTTPEGVNEVGSNGIESNGGQQTGTAQGTSGSRNTSREAGSDAGQNGGNTQQPTTTGTEQPRSKRGSSSGTTGGVSSGNVVEDPTVDHGDHRVDDGSLRTPKEKNTPKNTRNYLYPEDAGEIDNMSPMERLETNVEALEVLRTLLTEGREATPEERATLGKLRGWGGINVPDNYTARFTPLAMNPLQKRLVAVVNALDPNGERKLLDSLRTASLTSYYTPIPIARAMHAIAEQAGYKGNGNMLDPSMGNGVFEGSMAKGVQQSTNIRGVELDWLTGQIAQKLYPDAHINITGFQDAHIPQDYYDYVVSNIPFGSLQITDLDWQKNPSPIRKAAQGKIHNYFAVKMIESTRPGGLCVIMTSNAIMDTPGNMMIREYITEKCEVLGAIRLPNNTFKGAGTRVVTDVIYLRKFRNVDESIRFKDRADYWSEIATPFKYTEKQPLDDKNGATHQVNYNTYYQLHPENIIGTPVAGGQYSDEAYDQESNLSTDELAQQLETIGRRFMDERKKRFGNITVNTNTPRAEIQERIKERYKGNGRYESSGNIVVQDGKIGKLEGTKEGNVTQLMFAEQKLGSATVAQVTDYANLRSLLKQLIHVQIENYTSDRIDEVRKQMQQAYTAYTKKYGKLCEKKNAFIEEDIDGYQVRALEQWKDGKFVGMADIYTKNTIASERDMNDVSDPQAAVLNSLAEYGNINTEYLQRVLGDNFAEACKGLIFEDPSHQGEYIARDVYLSGDVVTKLEYARQMAEEDSRFQENVTALEAIQPKRKEFGEFPCHMGARWIPVQIYNDFLNEIFGVRGNWKGQKTGITYVEATNEYIFNFVPSEFGGNAAKYATSRKSASDIFQAALLDKDITVKYKDDEGKEHTDQEATDAARDKVAELREAFEDWVPQKPERVQQLTDTYNSVFNRHVLPTYNGQHLNIVGLQGMKLRPHQKDAVWRIINQRGGIVDHIVGAGKSLVMQASIMEMRRMGIAKKPMILALKSTTQQIANEFRQAFPAARVLAPTEADFSTQNRKRFLAQIAVNDYDCIILSHEQYSALDHTEAIKRSFIEDQIAQLDNLLEYLYGQKDESQLTKKQIKGLEKRKENLKERLKKLELIRTDEEFVFENLGVDYLFVDECQAFKNLMFQTSYSQIAGLGNPEGSERSTKLLYGVRALQEMHQGDMGTVFLSGTTITNSLSELYNIFNYLRPNEMARMGLNTFDAWASTFAVRSTEAEFGATNELKEKSRFRKFEGLQELSRLYTEIADVRNDNNLELPKPKLHTVFVSIPISDTMKKINDAITDMVKNHNGSFFNINPANDYKYPWSLSATNLAKLATLSPKLIDPSYDDENGKIFHVCENIKKIYDQFNDQKGVQLVFCDAGVPGPGKKYDAYTDIIRRLTKDYGIPRSEIADIHEAGDDAKRQALFKKVNEGKVRIVIGGTKNMGTGVNVQQRVVAMHHLDIPWTPADVNQRNGRGSRQGNEIARDYNNNQVDAYYYAVERTLDTYRYQLQDVKGKMIDSFKMANVGVNEFDEGGGDDNMSPAEMVAILSGNPVILDKAKQDKLVDKLKRLQRSSVTEYARRKSEYELLQNSQSTMQDLIRRNAEDIETLKRNGYEQDAEGNWPTLHPVLSEYERVSSGKTFEKPTELGAAIHARIKETGTAYLYAAGINAKVMPYVDSYGETKLGEYELQAQTYSGVRYTVKLSDDDTAAGQAMQNLLRKIYSNAEVYKHRLEEVNNKLEGADPGEYSFPRQAELDAALAKKREIDAEYNKLIVSDKKPKPTEEKPEKQLLNLDYDAELTDEQKLATRALIETLNDNTDLDVFLATDEQMPEDGSEKDVRNNKYSQVATDAWNKYQYDGELESIRDVAEYIEENMPKDETTTSLFDAIDKYRVEEEEDRMLYGERGDLEPFEDAILAEIEKLMQPTREAMRTPDGTLYGWAIGDRIYLTKDGLNPNSPIHEYSHIWAKAMMRNNREGWQSIVDIFKGMPFWDEVVNDPNYQGLTTDDAICSEVLARYSGQRGAARMEEWAKEELYEAEQSGSLLRGAKVRQLINRAKKALADFWHWVGVNLFGIKHFDSAKQVADRVLWDMLNGTELKPEDQTTTNNFKAWFGDWQNDPEHASKVVDADGKPSVVEHSTPNEFTTFDINRLGENSGDKGIFGAGFYFGDRGNTDIYGKNHMQVYLNMRKPFVMEDYMPDDISAFIVEHFNTPALRKIVLNENGKSITVGEYIDIVNAVNAEMEEGKHDAEIERISSFYRPDSARRKVRDDAIADKSFLIPGSLNYLISTMIGSQEFTNALRENGNDGVIVGKGNGYNEYVVFSPNQIKSATNNNGEFSEDNNNIEMMISGYTPEKQRIINEWYAAHPRPQYQVGEKLDHYQARLEAWEKEYKQFRASMEQGRSNEAPTFNGMKHPASTGQSTPLQRDEAPAFVPGVRPTPMANETPYEYALRLRQYYQLMRDERLVAEYVAEINNQADAAAKVLKKNTIVRGLLDAAKPIENFQEWMKQRGATITDESNAYTDTFLATGRVTEANEQMQRDIIRPLAKQIAKIIAPDAKTGKSRLDGINIVWHNMDVAGTGSKLDGKALTPREIIGVYCQAKDCAEAIEKGLPDRGAKGFLNNLGMSHDDVIAAVESVIPRAELDELWRLINAATHFALNYDYESGRISEDTHTEFYQREFYVPQRGWRERDESGLITEYEPVGKRGNDPYNAALVKAHGRQSLASDPFAYIMSIDASSIVSSENNKIKQKFLRFCLDNEDLGLQTGAFRVKKYWIMNVIDPETGKIKLDEEGNPMMEVSYVAPSAEDLSHDRTIKELIKKKRKEWAKVNQAYLERQSHGELGPQLEAAYKTKLSKIEQAIEDLEQQMHIAWNATNTNITQRTSDEKKQHEVRVLLDGQEYLIEVQDEKLANAINKKFKQHQEQLFNTSQKMRNATRFMSAVLTQYNPEFAASNFARDFQVALATLTAEHPELVGSFLKNFAACQPAVWQYAFNDKVRDRAVFRDSELGRYLQEYFKAGAATGFSYMQDLKSLRQDFDAMVNESNLRRGIKGAVGTLSMLTEVSETAVRFAGYVSARQNGMGINEAAYLSKELTTNFDRAGEVADSGWMSWFSFFRATLNGNIKFLKALKKMPLAYSLIAAAYVAMGMLNQFLNPDDPDDEVWAGDYTRESNFVIGKWRIPTAHFLRMFFAAGVNAAKWMQGEKSFGEATYNTATFATNELLPDYLDVMNWTDWDSDTGRMTMPWDGDNYKKGVRGFIPTPISPIADVWANRDFMGATINYPADDGKKDILRAKKKTLPIYQMLTQTIYEGVGGNMNTKRKSDDPAWRSWLFDTSASSVEHVVEGYMPSGMDMFITLGEAIYDAATGTPTGPDKWPFVRKFYNAYTPERAYMQQYYLLNGRVKEFKRNMDDYRKNDRTKYNILTHSQEYRNYQEAERLVKKQKENPTTADVQALINANKQWIK